MDCPWGRRRRHAFSLSRHHKSPFMMMPAPFVVMEGTQEDGSWSGFANDLFIKNELGPLTSLVPSERSLAGPGTSEAATPSMGATKRKTSADCRRWRRTGRRCEASGSPWSHRRLVFQSRIVRASIMCLAAYAASPGELNRIVKKICRYLCAFSKGKARRTTAQLDKGPTPSQVEGAPRTSRDRNQKGQWWQAAQPRTLAGQYRQFGDRFQARHKR